MPRVAVEGGGRVVHLEEGEGVGVEDVHRVRVAVEQLAVLAFELAGGLLGPVLRGLGGVPGPPGLLAPLAFDRVPDGPADRLAAAGPLDQVVLGPGVEGASGGLFVVEASEHHDRQLVETLGERRDRLQPLRVGQ